MSLTYESNILVDCSQVRSVSSNNKSWTNNIAEPIELNPEDSIQIYSAFINNKSSSETIEITGDPVPAVNDDGSVNPDFNMKDNEANLTITFYKNATGINTIPMPYGFHLASLQKNGIVMRDGFENCGLQNRTAGSAFETNAPPTGEGFANNVERWFEWCQDNQLTEDTVHNVPLVQTFAVCSDVLISDDNVTRFGALPTGNPQATGNYTGANVNINPFKTYIGDVCQELDGTRCIGYYFDASTNKYTKYTRTVNIKIRDGSYSPSNLAEIITNQLGISQQAITKATDENFDKNGFFITTPTTELDDALYISREKILNAEKSTNYEQMDAGTIVPIYPRPSPLVAITETQGTGAKSNWAAFRPDIDTYFECGKTDQTLTTITSGSGEEPTGFRCDSYDWAMFGAESDDTRDRPVNVYFTYPQTLEAGQNLVEKHGLKTLTGDEHIIDFNYDLKIINTPSAPSFNDPSIPANAFGSKRGLSEDPNGYAFVKGDYGYIITNLEWTSENLLLFKKFFDAQLIEDNITNCYVYDYGTFHPKRTTATYPVDRNDIIRGSIDVTSSGGTLGNRWINIGMNNTLDLESIGGLLQLLQKDGSTLVYDTARTDYQLMEFGNDFVGDDEDLYETITPNRHFSFNLINEYNHSGQTDYLLGNKDLEAIDSSDTPAVKISPSGFDYANGTGKLNGNYDINSKNMKYCTHTQLIDVKESYTDKNGNEIAFTFPTPETKFFENEGYGYMYRYTSSNDNKDYIMFYVNKESGGLQRDVLPYKDTNYQATQALGWIPFFSSHGNQAIMSVTGQGTGVDRLAELDENNGDIEIETYQTTMTQTGIGATSNGAQFVYDDIVSRFTIQNFYTTIISSNFYNFSGASGQTQNPNAGNEIVSYNINNAFYYKVETGFDINLHPDTSADAKKFTIHNAFNKLYPYNYRETLGEFKGEGVLSLYYQQTGCAIDKWVEIRDEQTNEVLLDENETNFNNSLWAKLGFTYAQTHEPKIDIFDEVGNFDISAFRNSGTINQNGSVDNQKYYSLPITNNSDILNVQFNNLLFENPYNFNMYLNNPANSVNSLEIISKSTIFIADNLPTRSTDPFFIIESNILSVGGIGQNYFAQNSIYSGIDIVEKSFNSNDYYIKDGGITHIVSKPYTLNYVTHQIRRNNGNLLDTNQFSSVIYLITKRITIGLTPEQQEEKQELIEEDKMKRLKQQKTIDELSGTNLTNKQKLLKSILYKNIIEKRKRDIEESTDGDIEDLFDEEVEEEEPEDIEEQEDPINLQEDKKPLTVILGRAIGGGILLDDEPQKNIMSSMGEEELFKSVKSFNLPTELRAENLFTKQPDTRLKTFPTFRDIKPPQRKVKVQKEKIKKPVTNIEPLKETLTSRLATISRKPRTESRYEKPEPYFRKPDEEEEEKKI